MIFWNLRQEIFVKAVLTDGTDLFWTADRSAAEGEGHDPGGAGPAAGPEPPGSRPCFSEAPQFAAQNKSVPSVNTAFTKFLAASSRKS